MKKLNDSNPKKHYLFCPGPVNVAENVKQRAIAQDVCHREEDFMGVLKDTSEKILSLFEIKKRKDYSAVIITGSGTAANEAVLSSVVGSGRILIITNGEFGERLWSISKIYNKKTKLLQFDWGEKLDLEIIEEAIKKDPLITTVAMVHHETSTGMLNSIAKVGKITRKYKKLFFVDAVSSASAEKIDMESWNIGFLSTSAAKAISSYPGASIVVGRKSEFEKIKDLKQKNMFLSLYKFYHFIEDFSQTPNTPAVHTIYALNQAITNILDEGIQARRERIQNLASLLREGMQKMGLTFLIPESHMCSILTTVTVPDGIREKDLVVELRKRRITVYGGKGPLLGKIFQVANIGEINEADIVYFLKSLSEILKQLYYTNKLNIAYTHSNQN